MVPHTDRRVCVNFPTDVTVIGLTPGVGVSENDVISVTRDSSSVSKRTWCHVDQKMGVSDAQSILALIAWEASGVQLPVVRPLAILLAHDCALRVDIRVGAIDWRYTDKLHRRTVCCHMSSRCL